MLSRAWTCAFVSVICATGAWADNENRDDNGERIVIVEKDEIEHIQREVSDASREILEAVREALEEAREETREEARTEREVSRDAIRIRIDERNEIREALREALRESQGALEEAGEAVRELVAQNIPALSASIGPLLSPSVMFLGDSGAGNARTVDETKNAAGVSEVEVKNISGKIVVIGWDRDEIQVRGTIGEDVEELIFGVDGSSAEVRVKIPDGRHRNLKIKSELTIQVPKRVRLRARTVSGGIDAQRIEGPLVELSTVSGGIEVSGCTGDIDVETTSGGIDVRDAQREVDAECTSGGIKIDGSPSVVSAHTVSGGVTIDGAREEVECESVSGRVKVTAGSLTRFKGESVSGGVEYEGGLGPNARFDLNTLSGGVRLRLPADVSADFDLHSFSGGIYVDLPGAPSSGKKQLSFTTGNGDGDVVIEAFSGGIRVERK